MRRKFDMRLHRVVLLLFFLIASKSQDVYGCDGRVDDEYQPEWKSCKQDADCVVIKGTCGSSAAVHQDFKNDAECHFQLASQKMPYCPKYLEPPIQDVYCDTDIEMCIIKFQK